MNKKISALVLLLCTIPQCIQPAAKKPTQQPQNPTVLLNQALELASILKTPIETAFGDTLFNDILPEEHTETYLLLDEKITALQIKLAKTTNKPFMPVNKLITQLTIILNNADPSEQAAFQQKMQEIYPLFISKFTRISTKILGKGPFFLKLNIDKNPILQPFENDEKKTKILLEDIVNIVSLLWIKYINVFDNKPIEITFTLPDNKLQKHNLTPLKWAYYTAHAGATDFNKKNPIVAHYSKPFIQNMLETITNNAKKRSGLIISEAGKNPLTPQIIDKIKREAFIDLMSNYLLILQPKQKHETFFRLKQELSDAFPTSTRAYGLLAPQLPEELENTLTALAAVWLALKNNNIIQEDEIITLNYPTIYASDSKTLIGLTFDNWMYYTAYAGYEGITHNVKYEEFLTSARRPKKIKTISDQGKGIFARISNWFSSEEDDFSDL